MLPNHLRGEHFLVFYVMMILLVISIPLHVHELCYASDRQTKRVKLIYISILTSLFYFFSDLLLVHVPEFLLLAMLKRGLKINKQTHVLLFKSLVHV